MLEDILLFLLIVVFIIILIFFFYYFLKNFIDSDLDNKEIRKVFDEEKAEKFLEQIPEEKNIVKNEVFEDFKDFSNKQIDLLESQTNEEKDRNIKKIYLEKGKILDQLYSKLNAREFEIFVKMIFVAKGYKVALGPGEDDEGVDVAVFPTKKYPEFMYIQCKKWNPNSTNYVGVRAMREFAGALVPLKPCSAMLVTTSSVTKKAIDFAKIAGIKVWHRYNFEDNILKVFGEGFVIEIPKTEEIFETCEVCKVGKMIEISENGKEFLRCSKYPECRFVNYL